MVQKHVGLLHAERTEALARVLSGLETDAKVEHVDDSSSLSEERIAEIKSVPGVNLEKVAAERRPDVLRALNKEIVHVRLRPDGRQVPRRRSLLPRQPAARAVDC